MGYKFLMFCKKIEINIFYLFKLEQEDVKRNETRTTFDSGGSPSPCDGCSCGPADDSFAVGSR